jgi:hypothetical protein
MGRIVYCAWLIPCEHGVRLVRDPAWLRRRGTTGREFLTLCAKKSLVWGMRSGPLRYYDLVIVEPDALFPPPRRGDSGFSLARAGGGPGPIGSARCGLSRRRELRQKRRSKKLVTREMAIRHM